jgi:hypothetical protein
MTRCWQCGKQTPNGEVYCGLECAKAYERRVPAYAAVPCLGCVVADNDLSEIGWVALGTLVGNIFTGLCAKHRLSLCVGLRDAAEVWVRANRPPEQKEKGEP